VKLLDSRRLTGVNVVWERPCAVVDVEFDEGDDVADFITNWCNKVATMLSAVGWPNEQTASHDFIGGVSLVVSAPIDGLYAAVELVEWAFEASVNELQQNDGDDFDGHVERLKNLIREEAYPRVLEMAAGAEKHAVAFLWDDDEVSVGLGKGSITWPATELPATVDWSKIHNIPVGVVTGTNGKTTTVRLASHIVRAAGRKVGLSSTDWIGVDDEIIERGDYSGPGGARTALRQRAIDVAILETARGGLLRRGLGPQRADAAVITNIAEDHLGDFGSQDLSELLDLKWIVMDALDDASVAILNADDPLLVQKAQRLTMPVIWFSLDPENSTLQRSTAAGGSVLTVVNDTISRIDGETRTALCAVNDVPITLQGSAKHNIANALAAVALSGGLGIPDEAIVAGLQSMTTNENPGRCNLFSIAGVDVLLDFAHNPEAMAAIFEIARDRPANRRVLCFGQAGDRTDEQIRELARGAWAIGLDRVIVSELADYRRGREPGEVYGLLKDELVRIGASTSQISHNELESESFAHALAWAEPGDFIIMLALGDATSLLRTIKALSD
jgi:cyanophycin synthetase